MTFIYDVENRLVRAMGAKQATLTYDPMGRLWQVDGTAAGGTITRFLYDGDALVAEYDAPGNVTDRYVHGVGADVPTQWYEGSAVNSSTRHHLFANWQGSIALITDASGTTVNINAYDAYGIANETNIGRFQYTGQIAIPELGLYHYKARVYSPTLGRFLQTDPIGYEDQVNLYAYVGNDPVNLVDPTGMKIALDQNMAESDQEAFLSLIDSVAKAGPEFEQSIADLHASENTHILTTPSAASQSTNRNLRKAAKTNPPQNIGVAPQSNETNGVGTSTITILDPTSSKTFQKRDGTQFTASPESQLVHELLAHGGDKDVGQIDRTVDPSTGVPNHEQKAVDMADRYRKAVGEAQCRDY